MWRGDVILARGDMRTVALHHIIPVKGKQACEPKSFQSLRKLDRRTRIVHALEVSESSCARKLRDRKPSLFNTFEIFDHTGFPAERFTSQAFWDAFEQILPETSATLAPAEDPLDQAQLRLLGLWKEKQLVGRWLLAYDTTNFYTYIASTNTRNQLAQRGHNKQGRHNLRQVGLS